MQDFPDKSPPAFLRPLVDFPLRAVELNLLSVATLSCVLSVASGKAERQAAKPSGKRQSRADLGVLGKLYPAVNGRWDTNADNLSLQDMKPKVNYKAGDDILASRW